METGACSIGRTRKNFCAGSCNLQTCNKMGTFNCGITRNWTQVYTIWWSLSWYWINKTRETEKWYVLVRTMRCGIKLMKNGRILSFGTISVLQIARQQLWQAQDSLYILCMLCHWKFKTIQTITHIKCIDGDGVPACKLQWKPWRARTWRLSYSQNLCVLDLVFFVDAFFERSVSGIDQHSSWNWMIVLNKDMCLILWPLSKSGQERISVADRPSKMWKCFPAMMFYRCKIPERRDPSTTLHGICVFPLAFVVIQSLRLFDIISGEKLVIFQNQTRQEKKRGKRKEILRCRLHRGIGMHISFLDRAKRMIKSLSLFPCQPFSEECEMIPSKIGFYSIFTLEPMHNSRLGIWKLEK